MIRTLLINIILLFSLRISAQSKANASAFATIVNPVGVETGTDVLKDNLSLTSKISSSTVIKSSELTTVPIASFTVIGDAIVYTISMPVVNIILKKGRSKEKLKAFCFTTNNKLVSTLARNNNSFNVVASVFVDPKKETGYYVSQNDLELIVNFN